MLYHPLGKTGFVVSQLGFGAMRLPMVGEGDAVRVNRELAIPMIHRAFEAGVNYIDTAIGYCKQDSQRAVGDALKGWRDKVVVSTKNNYYGLEEAVWWKNLEDSLQRLGVDSIDLYNHHGIRWARYEEFVAPTMSQWMAKAKDQGLIKHIGCSFHDTNDALRKLVDTGYAEVITLQYNLLDRQLEDGIAYAHERGIGVVVMGPVGGGRLGADSETLASLIPGIRRIPELALRFVLANPACLGGAERHEHDAAGGGEPGHRRPRRGAIRRRQKGDRRAFGAPGGAGQPLLHRLRVLPALPQRDQHPQPVQDLQPREGLRAVGPRPGSLRAGPQGAHEQEAQRPGRRVQRLRHLRDQVPPEPARPQATQGTSRGPGG